MDEAMLKHVKLRAQRGAAMADLLFPGWWKAIDWNEFDINDGTRCVLKILV